LVNPNRELNIVVSPDGDRTTSNARVQIPVDDIEKILGGVALWFNSPAGEHRETAGEKIPRPVTGVRLNVYCGKWRMQVRQS
jgi:hypothetical protein